MSFSRHACRHALQPPTSALIDHVWISDDLLTSSFKRFANCQKRHESKVPGPLEARRRLAKRRNTALASVGNYGLPDMGSLFGRNGTGHMKWRSNDSNVPCSSQFDLLGSYSYVPTPSAPPMPSFLADGSGDLDAGIPFGWSKNHDQLSTPARDELLEEELKKYWKVDDIRKIVCDFDLDLKHDPAYSQMIFGNMLSHTLHQEESVAELIAFLDDPTLNARNAGNYLSLVEYLVANEISTSSRDNLLRAVNRALELGLIPTEEISLIIEGLPEIRVGSGTLRSKDSDGLARCYRSLWDALRSCNVLRIEDLEPKIFQSWLDELAQTELHKEVLLLARDIIVSTHPSPSQDCSWVPCFISQWMSLPAESSHEEPGFDQRKYNNDYVQSLLACFSPYLASRHVALKAWRACLNSVSNPEALLSSRAWLSLRSTKSKTMQSDGLSDEEPDLPSHQEILLRLWILKSLGRSTSLYISWKLPQSVTMVVSELLTRFNKATRDWEDRDVLANLLKGLNELDIPSNNVMMMVIAVRTKKQPKDLTRTMLKQLEASEQTIMDLFANRQSYQASHRFFCSSFQRMVRKIDITSTSFIEQCLNIAKSGSSDYNTDYSIIFRILRSHTPLKIALSQAWGSPPDLDSAGNALALARDSEHPDPHACLELIHLLAITFATSKNLTARQAYRAVHWLYVFLMSHDAPIKPPIVRAMYHCGVTRYQQAGVHVSSVRYQFILDLVREAEDPEVYMALRNVPA
ncbi:conserved hypothetical protein [Paecilomyces variotii No. 5]|uniref:Uncharacterized protein n=1 Tax=Byssochlamys spectabilis (strain No. 5 / NBRC 109023) TaxID=1356009 RepID=V5FNU1_BYSSN|nr:conserved hypothetical protein [Paecilomyces variotii No. 5]